MSGGKNSKSESANRSLSPFISAPILGILIGVTITVYISQLSKVPTESKNLAPLYAAQERLEQKIESFVNVTQRAERISGVLVVEEKIRKYRDLWLQGEFEKAIFVLESAIEYQSPYNAQLLASKAQVLAEKAALQSNEDAYIPYYEQFCEVVEIINVNSSTDYILGTIDSFRTHETKPIPFVDRELRERVVTALEKVIELYNTHEYPSLSWRYILESVHVLAKVNDFREQSINALTSLLKHESSERRMISIHGSLSWGYGGLNRPEWRHHAHMANLLSSQWSQFLRNVPDRTQRGVVAFYDWSELNATKILSPNDPTAVYGKKIPLPRSSPLSQPIFLRFTDNRDGYAINIRNTSISRMGFLNIDNTQYYMDSGFVPTAAKQVPASNFNFTTKYGKCFLIMGSGSEYVLDIVVPSKILLLIKSGLFQVGNPEHFLALPTSRTDYFDNIIKTLGIPVSQIFATKSNMIIDDLTIPVWKDIPNTPFQISHLNIPPYFLTNELRRTYVPKPLFEPHQRTKIIWCTLQTEKVSLTPDKHLIAKFSAEFGDDFVIYDEYLPWEENIELFQSAKIVVTPHDRRMNNMIFLEPNSVWIELPTSSEIRKFTPSLLASALGIKFFNIQALAVIPGTPYDLSPANVDLILQAVREAEKL